MTPAENRDEAMKAARAAARHHDARPSQCTAYATLSAAWSLLALATIAVKDPERTHL